MISDTQLWHFWEHKFSQGASRYATVEWGETITRCYWLHLCMMSYTFSFWCAVVIKLNSSLDALSFDIIFWKMFQLLFVARPQIYGRKRHKACDLFNCRRSFGGSSGGEWDFTLFNIYARLLSLTFVVCLEVYFSILNLEIAYSGKIVVAAQLAWDEGFFCVVDTYFSC